MQFVTWQQQQRECIGLTARLATSLIRWFPRAFWAVLVRSIALKGTHERPKWKTEVEKCGGKRAKLVYCLLCRHPWIPWLHFVFVIVLLVHSLRASIAHGIQQGNKTRLPASELAGSDRSTVAFFSSRRFVESTGKTVLPGVAKAACREKRTTREIVRSFAFREACMQSCCSYIDNNTLRDRPSSTSPHRRIRQGYKGQTAGRTGEFCAWCAYRPFFGGCPQTGVRSERKRSSTFPFLQHSPIPPEECGIVSHRREETNCCKKRELGVLWAVTRDLAFRL